MLYNGLAKTEVETHAGTEDHGGGSSNPLLNPNPGVAIWTFITFIILLVVLKKLAWGPMLSALDKRTEAIRDSLAEAEKARDAASNSVEEQQRLLSEARREAQDLLQKSRSDAERAHEDLVTKARAEADKVLEQGRQTIEQEKRAAIEEIRAATVDIVIDASSKLLKDRIDDTKSRELVEANIRELEQAERS